MYVTVFSPPVKAQQLSDREAARRPQHQDVVILTHQAGSELDLTSVAEIAARR
jgi:hypothetical protein